MRKISKDNPVPIYYQIKEILLEMIENEELKYGDTIPTEREICEFQGVSRMTVNKAILELVNQGILYREQGKGTFVAKPKEMKELKYLKSFTEEMKEKGLDVEVKILSFQVKQATKQVKIMLNMAEEDNKVIEIKRLRISNNEPVAIETAYIPHNLCPDMTKEMIEGKSLYNIFRDKYKYYPDKAKQTIEPIMLNEYERTLLNQPSTSLALLFKRSTYTKDGIHLEYTNAIYRSDKYKYEVILE
ncbi:GntR family transcriptional regulator [Clostridium felsineum]|uniref:HTH-type transcriptional repressor NagR n=1 Tax=Clostridium felsineum TaxID=36839 RepID=A0A1S8MAH7_9CLOT|nr:GntR family transcriptional regulator [Clostridium felsineum]MCR3760448.1 GntR family transcriptional regulator [Clostridium felsineum]URZ02845.1 HTH-type transcriptional repressor NagR [Clostridium felsineum]URZ08831.1 HTH-type transcriptional repressor NagR [Clostridium felsineum]URZ09459.1 HTH-type transcriptional repressor NagR [Clostridium felsineum]URZ14185.1 HTH-type transcriptional repressor NagR [Clostridium felsineum DSM 794]